MRTLLLFIACACTACTSAPALELDAVITRQMIDRKLGANPVVTLRARAYLWGETYRHYAIRAYAECEHISSYPNNHDGHGINLCGGGATVRFGRVPRLFD